MNRPARRVPLRTLFASLLAIVLAGCSTAPVLAPPPFVMLGEEGRSHYENLPERLRTPEIPIVFFTDRNDERAPGSDQPVFGSQRSDISTYGVATIRPEQDLTWAEFVEISTQPEAHRDIKLRVEDVRIQGNIGSVLSRLAVEDGRLVQPPRSVLAFRQDFASFQASLEPWMISESDNAAIIFVHGFNSTFEGSALRLAKTWHAIGREGVPILFTWPAGFDAFKPIAYNRDRESGEFAVKSLKTLLLALALNDRIARVHLVAHSRGTDVAATAIRELHAELDSSRGATASAQIAMGREFDPARDTGRLPADVLKLRSLILVAPDLDLEVFTQRFVAEQSGAAAKTVTIYTSAKDRAIGIADIFFGSEVRLGQSTFADFDPRVQALVGALPNVDLIECRVKTKDSHLYLFEHPAALSDMVRLVRDQLPAGPEHGRPLEPIAPGFWALGEDYLRPEPISD